LGLSFDVQIYESGFEERFLSFINQAGKGDYHGLDQGRSTLKSLLNSGDFNSETDAMTFTAAVLESLETVNNTVQGSSVNVQIQLRQSRSPVEVYDFIFGLAYLHPRFHLQMHHKDLSTLSPGERGALLLVFYLLLDQSEMPLVIDQPEENLDNQSVFEILVPCIKEAKMRRQIIMVTHNANLGVVCDSEQIVYAQMDKVNSVVTYDSGSIENPEINRHITDVLEGTMPAFRNREKKYLNS
jgi:ATPase subunit of ABC transporter with duplicated ATPase domains